MHYQIPERQRTIGIASILIVLTASCHHATLSGPNNPRLTTPRTSPATPIILTVDLAKECQVIDNFGASDCWSMQKLGVWSDANKNRLADLLFSREKGIGLSCWRFNIGAGLDYENMGADSWRTVETFETAPGQYDWSRQAGERWFLAAAKARGVEQFVAFCNSPPARLTRNGRTYCGNSEDSTNLKEGAEPDFARYIADILQYFRDNPDPAQRISFDWISPINEPQWDWTGSGQEGCRASNQDIKQVILALDAALHQRQLNTRILVPESGSMFGLRAEHADVSRRYHEKYGDYFNDFCNDPAINAKIGNVLCGHSYWFDKVPELLTPQREKLRNTLDKYPAWRYWMTEYCIMSGPENQGGGGRDLTMKTALDVARVIHCDLTLCRASAWQWWTAVSAADYKDGLIYTDYHKPGDAETIYPAKTLWAFGNYSRFIRPGAIRIQLDGASDIQGLLGSAYKDPATGQMIIVLINMAANEKTISMNIRHLPHNQMDMTFTPYITSEKDDLAPYPPIQANASYTIPARAAVSLVSMGKQLE